MTTIKRRAPYHFNRATLPEQGVCNARNLGDDKETIHRKVLVAHDVDGFHELVDARWYMGRSKSASVVYCSVWVHGPGCESSGYGTAGGYGYHKTSAAFQAAAESAGIRFEALCDGCGDGPMELAIRAIGHAMGYANDAMVIV